MPPNNRKFETEIEHERFWNVKEKKKPLVSAYTRSPYKFNPCDEAPLITQIGVQFCHTILICMGFIAELLKYYRLIGSENVQERKELQDFAPLGNHFNSMFVNNIYKQASDVVSRPVCCVPATKIIIQERDFNNEWSLKSTGNLCEVINMGSYNYLGFSQIVGPCADAACEEIDKRGLHNSSDYESEIVPLQRRLEKQVSEFIGSEDALCFPNGFGINTMVLPRLANKDTLIMSDQLNHSSLLVGMKTSNATVIIFNHNDMNDLERKLRNALANQFAIKAPILKKILIVVEGIYSMEGTIVNLPRLIEIKQKYNAYLFVDEAHSIGALGATGRGIIDYWGCNSRDIDVLMGTFTKSFGSSGGYIAGKKQIVKYLRLTSPSRFYASLIPPPLITQTITSMKIMMGEDGTSIGRERNERLIQNTRYFRQKLKEMDFCIYGHDDTAIISVLTFYMPKSILFGREALKRGLAICCVGYPAVPLNKSRVRFCISSEHTKEQMDQALKIADICGDLANIKYSNKTHRLTQTISCANAFIDN